jgi:hypothetical protein
MQQAPALPCDVEIVENCDHYYNDREFTIADLVAGWLKKALIDG